jgi:hypothetical protein
MPYGYSLSGRRKRMQRRNQTGNQARKVVIVMKGFLDSLLAMAVAVCVSAGITCEARADQGEEVRDLIENLEVGEPSYYENLTIVPVYSTTVRDYTRYATLDDALDRGWLEITEVGGGTVPKVSLTNRSDECIFIMGGEILTGCRQDRIVGRDILLRPRARNVIIPVYCVEQGRWTYESETFHSKRNLGTPGLRAESQKAQAGAQRGIWGHISDMFGRSGTSSGTSRYQEIYESDAVKRRMAYVEKEMGGIPRLYPDAIGVVIGVGDEVASADIFANPHVFRELWPKILRASAVAACDHAHGSITQADAVWFLRSLHDKHYGRKPAIDLGFEVSVVDREANVNALVYHDGVTHLAAFPEHKMDWGKTYPEDSERRIPVRRR